MIAHAGPFSTSCANLKHILSLDRTLPTRHLRRVVKIGDRLRAAREKTPLSQTDVGKQIGVAQTTVGSWERNRTEPTRENVEKLARLYRIPLAELEGVASEPEAPPKMAEVPLISWVSAGQLKDAGQLPSTRYAKLLHFDDLPPGGEYFATDVKGDSMDRVSPEGSRIIVNVKEREPLAGRFYIFSLRGETTYKRFQGEPVIRLEPFSTNPSNQIIFPKADKDWIVIGRVVRTILNLDQFNG